MSRSDDEFHAFVAERLDRWRRSAYLLCGDWHLADDLVSQALVKLHRNWSKVRGADNVDAYAQKVLTRCWLTERGRRWRHREQTHSDPPHRESLPDDRVVDRLPLADLLRSLGPRQRAVLILRFYLDHSVEETAEILGVSPGTVKSQSARALGQLRIQTPR
ncbi:SigE family RNA polymerase sigma factor [Virgisporangium aurantiacum]|uniref:RNA polymerase sigma24 factor n=1 Tax=Virgisporangium aurantiacum TaxID=175570 RepID=A0A8J3Z7G2_9ACTN|nr:SigE family RNA polymerase sigma factor [Virgisporangium aurantiacum]GIJ57738.1 RNA polymerase sigma24 factor [Virgisporangium aurantiacum]